MAGSRVAIGEFMVGWMFEKGPAIGRILGLMGDGVYLCSVTEGGRTFNTGVPAEAFVGSHLYESAEEFGAEMERRRLIREESLKQQAEREQNPDPEQRSAKPNPLKAVKDPGSSVN